jgi:glycosyltransferase involved in cell wall biosynthesis
MSKRKTIVHVINSLPIGGAELLLLHTLPLLEDYDHVICYLHAPDTLAVDFAPWPVICIHHQAKLNTLRSVRKLSAIIKEYQADIVHAHLLDSTWIARLACPRQVKFVFTLHSILSQDAFLVNKLSLWMEKLLVSSRQNLIAVSQTVLNDYQSFIPFKGKTWVLHNFVSQRFFQVNRTHDYVAGTATQLKLVAIGNLKAAKNYVYLLEVFKQLKGLPVSLHIYGEGQERESLQRTIDERGLAVELKGSVSGIENVLPLYDLYITSSLHEGYGIAPLEALASGTPVLASDIPVFKEVLGKYALYFELTDVFSLVELIQQLLQRKIDLPQQAKEGREWARTIASVKTYQDKLRSIYQQILTVS